MLIEWKSNIKADDVVNHYPYTRDSLGSYVLIKTDKSTPQQ